MPVATEIGIFADSQLERRISTVQLAEVEAPVDFDILVGEPVKLYGANLGNRMIRDVAVSMEGEGASNVQLAVDSDGEPGAWAAVGESIIAQQGDVSPNGVFSFWARAVYHPDDAVGDREFDFVFSGMEIA